MADLDRSIAESTLRWWRELAELNPQDLAPRIDAMLKQAPPAAVFKSTAKRVAALQALDAAQAPPAAAVFKITVSDHTGTHDYEAWAGLQAPPAAADCPMVKKWSAQADELAACQTAEAIDRVLAERAQGVKP